MQQLYIDPRRHENVFSPSKFGARLVDVIGAGALGSPTVEELAKQGVTRIRVWDHDKVESYNVPNQVYGNNHVGMLKVDALAQIVLEKTGLQIETRAERFEGQEPLGDVVFICVDDMDVRKAIWDTSIRYNPHVSLMIESRMGVDTGRIYAIMPTLPHEVKGWEKRWYPNPPIPEEAHACTLVQSIGPTAKIIAEAGVWQFFRAFAISEGAEDKLENEVIFSFRPFGVMSSVFPII